MHLGASDAPCSHFERFHITHSVPSEPLAPHSATEQTTGPTDCLRPSARPQWPCGSQHVASRPQPAAQRR